MIVPKIAYRFRKKNLSINSKKYNYKLFQLNL